MPLKKKKYNARFPPGRIKKIMQTDEEVGKVAAAVPIIISRTLELFVESLLTKTLKITNARHAKTLSPSHMCACIMSESRFDFLRELVKNVPDICVGDDGSMENSLSPNPHAQGGTTAQISSMPNHCYPPLAANLDQNGDDAMRFNSNCDNVRFGAQFNQRQLSFDGTAGGAQQTAYPQLFHGGGIGGGTSTPNNTSLEPGGGQILKRKLADNSRKASTSLTPTNLATASAKLTRYDSSPAAFNCSPAVSGRMLDRALSNNTSGKEPKPTSKEPISYVSNSSSGPPSALLPPSLNINANSIGGAVIKIDYSGCSANNHEDIATSGTPSTQSTGSPIINIDFSNMVSSPALTTPTKNVNNSSSNGNGGLSLSSLPLLADMDSNYGVATPNLTTPTPLNHVPFGNASSNLTTASPISLPMPSFHSSSSIVEMDEDYDNI